MNIDNLVKMVNEIGAQGGAGLSDLGRRGVAILAAKAAAGAAANAAAGAPG
ncbi:MAG: hypothetical protein ACREU3_07195 [Steroidobacteraceae bacterium]